MSTHRLDVSGQRAVSLTLNDPASTAAQTNAKAGDDVRVQVGNARETRIGLIPGVKIQRRQYVTRTQRRDNDNRLVKDPETGEVLYDEKPYESLYLVIPSGVTVFARCSSITDAADKDAAEGQPTYENTPRTSLFVKRLGAELDFSESGSLLAEHDLAELVTAE